LKKTKILSLALALFFILTFSAFAQADGFLQLIDAKGDAQMRIAKGSWIPVKAGTVLSERDSLRTKKGGWITLVVFEDKEKKIGTVELKENSYLRLKELPQKNKPDRGVLLDLVLGEVLVKAKPLVSKAPFEVKTPTSFVRVDGQASFSVQVEKLD